MKFSSLFVSTAACVYNLNGVISENTNTATLRGNSKNQPQQPSDDVHHRVLQEDTYATFAIQVSEEGPDGGRRLRKLQGNSPDKETLSIETTDGMIYDVVNAPPGWSQGNVSGETVVRIPKGSRITGATIDMGGRAPEGVGKPFGRLLEEIATEATPEQRRNLAELKRQQRGLARVTGDKTVLAVKVNHVGTSGLGSYSMSNNNIADSIFGTGDDLVNLVSQYSACSHGNLNFQPAAYRTGNGVAESVAGHVSDIINGVVTVTVDVACSGTSCDGPLRNAVNAALSNTFGSISSQYDHVMHCMPAAAMSGIAYAYVNSWNSVYKADWCTYTSTQLHEIGHNLNLAHSGEGTAAYADQTGFMGYSYSQDDQKMCFNNAKNSQLGWFSDAEVTLSAGQSYNGNLKGQVNYGNADVNGKVIVKIETGADPKYYIGYNHRIEHNSNTAEGGNQVTIQTYKGSGYGASLLVAKLSANGSYSTTANGETLTVTVGTISTSSTGVANVSISYGAPITPPPTNAPTNQPTPLPTSPPTLPPTNAPTNQPTLPPTNAPTNQPTPLPTVPITPPPTNAPVPPTPPPTNAPTDAPTPPPTNAPTNPPTPLPTSPPTLPPTNAPTNPPTPPPTNMPVPPTSPPTNAPTDAPTPPPTNAPTNPPTPQPTNPPVAFSCTSIGGGGDCKKYRDANGVRICTWSAGRCYD